jgi:tripartite-type tricarboxylate transporter receptor subunit TctC
MFVLAVTLGVALAPTASRAQDATAFPNHPIQLVVGYPPGGPPDLIARVVAPAIGDALGQAVVVQNKPGAGGIVAYGDVARAPHDGYTLLMADLSMVIDPLVYAKPGYDPMKDFAWVAPLARSYLAMFVNPQFPAATIGDFIAMAKKSPGALSYGTSGVGSPPYLGGLAFSAATGVNLQEVPYRGVALALTDLIANRVSTVWMSLGPAAGQVKAGQLRVLGVYGKRRLASLPDVPTFSESGVNAGAADNGSWFGLAAPAGTPPEIVAKINAATAKALAQPQVRQTLEGADYVVSDIVTPAELESLVTSSLPYWSDLFAKAGVKPE